jgi:cytoskeletal protein CcmA (bactofilin family)
VNLTVIPLLVVALLMVSGDPDVEIAQLMMTGNHAVGEHEGALIVGEAAVVIPAGAEVPGPVYVIGGELTVSGAVTGDVIQLAGTVTVGLGGSIGGELQHVAGTLVVSAGANIGRRSSLDLAGAAGDAAASGFLPAVVLILLLAGVGFLLTKKRRAALDNVAAAVTGHPVVTFTVGTLLALTFISLFVFMALTLVLFSVAVLGLLAGVLILGYGLIGWGHLIGARLHIRHQRLATVVGVVVVTTGVQLAGAIPLLGDLIVAAVLLTGLGAVVVTYFGVARFRPAALPD